MGSQQRGVPAIAGVTSVSCAPEGGHKSQVLRAHQVWQHVAFLGDLWRTRRETSYPAKGVLAVNTGCTPFQGHALPLRACLDRGTGVRPDCRARCQLGQQQKAHVKVQCKGSEHRAAWIAAPRQIHGCTSLGRKMLQRQLAKAQTQPAVPAAREGPLKSLHKACARPTPSRPVWLLPELSGDQCRSSERACSKGQSQHLL